MFNSVSLKAIPLSVALACAVLMGGAVYAQGAGGAGSSGPGSNAVERGASSAGGATAAKSSASKSAVTKPTMAKKIKPKARTNKRVLQQQPTTAGPTEDPSRIKP